FRIASNLVIDAYRRVGRELPEASPAFDQAAQEDAPETIVLLAERANNLREMIEQLAPDQKEVVLLRFAADMDTYEVGRVMDRNPNAVRQLQFRALQKLREMMRETSS
ncbi:MAG TPA: sigma-70 family RNA polymerase sigma factor, partial [Actinomycetota bacterium]|nr:sigma-70 family RNA polymerase sigma factor [Actinomycetota bacterium]